MSNPNLNPDQFLYHGTAMDVEGPRLLPAKVHGKGSYWGTTGSDTRGEAAEDHAWAHPDENVAWHAAHDRVTHTHNEHDWNPRARVYAVHPNENQSPGHDKSMAGEIKSTHFDIAQRIDTMPGRQGTFPEVNWNLHTLHTGLFTEDEDANHPTDKSAQFGHRYGRWGDHWNGPLRKDASDENIQRHLQRMDDLNIKPKYHQQDDTLPGMSKDGRRYQKNPRR